MTSLSTDTILTNGTTANTINVGTSAPTTNTLYYSPQNWTVSASSLSTSAISIDSNYIKEKIKQEKEKMEEKEKKNCQIIDIVEYVPEKVYKIVFKDKTEIKTIKDSFDEFNPEYMFYLALAKKLYSKTYTFDGILLKTYQLMNQKEYIKIVKKGLKLFNTLQEEKKKKEEYDKMKKRQREKNIRKKKAAKERKRQEQINIIAEAIRLSKEEG